MHLNLYRDCLLVRLLKFSGIVLLYIGVSTCVANAQNLNLKFKHINGTQGLSNSTIESILQDHRGFMWFGTRDGLNRYDGYKITVFRAIPGDSTSLSDNYIKCIYEDKNHTLWIGTLNGLNKFDPYTDRFTRYKHNPQLKNSVANNEVNCIYSDNKSNLWIGTAGGLDLMDANAGLFTHFKFAGYNPHSLPNDNVNCMLEDVAHNFWVGTDKGLALFNRNRRIFTSVSGLPGNQSVIIDYPVLKLQQDKQANLWLGSANNGLIEINLTAHQFKQYQHDDRNAGSISTNLVRALLIDKQGTVWAGGINGSLDKFEAVSGTFAHAQNEANNPQSLSQKTISSLFEDDQHNLWVGTHRGGINFYAPLANKFQLIQRQPDANSLSYNDVKAFYEDDQKNIWIGTDGGGLNLYNEATSNFKHYRYNVYDPSGISSDAVLSINQDSYKNLWIGTFGGGLNLMNKGGNSFTHFLHQPADKNSISSNYVQTTLEDSEGNFWVATYYGGLNRLDVKSHQFRRVTGDSLRQTSLYGNNVVTLNEDKEKNLWIGTDDGGLNCYNLIQKKFTHYFVNGEKTPDLRVIYTDSKGRVWVGQTGLYLFNKSKDQFALYTDKGGLSTEFIKGIIEDKVGNLWISTSNGLTKFNPETYSFKKYNTADGLQEQEYEAGAYMVTKSGEMFFGGINGFNKFYPQNIRLNQTVAPVYITDFSIFNQSIRPGKDSVLKNDISLTHEIELSHGQSTISFDFAILNYIAPENNQYAYQLANFDKTWHYTTERKASYTNLDPGEYTFYVKAANNDGVWNTKMAFVTVYIRPPYWATWWFRTLAVLVIFFVAYNILRFKRDIDLQKIEEDKRDEMHKVQLQFFTNISHEFRTPLSLILGPLEKMMEMDGRSAFRQYYDTIHRNANRLLLLINELMDFRKVETGSLKLKVMPGNMNLFIDEVAEDFRNLFQQKNIRLNIIIDREIGETWFDRQIVEKIILNLVDNAYKYSNIGGEVTIELYNNHTQFVSSHPNEMIVNNSGSSKKCVYIRVSDNGIGISKDSINHLFERYYRTTDSHLGSGVGLAFVKSLTLLHKGSIQVFSERDKGTDFIICLPVDKDDYQPNEKWMVNAAESHTQLESISAPFYQTDLKEIENEHIKPIAIPLHVEHYKILVVDDNKELRDFLRQSLGEFYEIVEAENGAAGIEKVKEELPDLIVSDLMMPVMNGIDFCKKIKGDARTGQIPFVILSAKDAIESKLEGADSGADLYFPKPVSISLLLLSIKNIFEQRRILKERYLKNYFVEAQEVTDSENDKEFLDHFIKLIESQLSNSDLDVDYLCREMGMSKTKLYHKIKGISGQSIGEFVRTFRLKKAAYIITHEDVLLTDAMYRVGIQTQSYFTKAFKKEFGKTPSQFLQEIKAGAANH